MKKFTWLFVFEPVKSTAVFKRIYIQVHSTCKQRKGESPSVWPYDSIAEISFDTMEDIPKVFSSENFKTTHGQDGVKFIDRDNIKWIYATENIVIG